MWMMGESVWAGVGSTIASVMFLWMAAQQYLPRELALYVRRWAGKLTGYVYPYVEISFPEYAGKRLKRSEAYTAIEAYLGTTCTERAKRLKAEMGKDTSNLVLSMAEYEEVTDVFRGATLWWTSIRASPRTAPSFSVYPAPDEKCYYRLTFHLRHREQVTGAYLAHVMAEGKAIGVRKRQRKLYTNSPNFGRYDYRNHMWSHVAFEHPATFDTLAMDPDKKRDIIQDLTTFRESKEYYASIGKPWKRGYLLYGPPGTGKSTMIAAMANFLDYDVYDLELTAVMDNSTLRKLLIETTSKSIMVIEDIDCTLDLTGKRKAGGDGHISDATEVEKAKEAVANRDKEDSKVTLSGLLNFIDGLWSACGGERIMVFTTNHVEKLDPALTRRGRMDKHIELSYCNFEAFKLLARNYLGVASHTLFPTVHHLIEEAKITPADVAENLIPKTRSGLAKDVDACLENLIEALKESKKKQEEEELKRQQEEEASKKKQEEEASKKQQEEEASKKKQEEEKAAAASPSKEDSSSNKDEEPKPEQSQ